MAIPLFDLPSRALLIKEDARERKLRGMQQTCKEMGVEFWPQARKQEGEVLTTWAVDARGRSD